MKLVETSLLSFRPSVSPKRLFIILTLLGFVLRMGFGVVRYRSALVQLSGQSFIEFWDHDPLAHILIAKALREGKGYVVDNIPLRAGEHVRFAGQEAVHKAPLYQFFLVGVFAISG